MNPTSLLISRKFLQTTDFDAFNGIPQTSLSPTTNAAATTSNTTTAATIRRPFNPSSHFDSSMALTILVLLTALFFLGFFSVYIRRFADLAETDPPPRRARPPPSKRGGLDASTVNSLPLVAYGGAAKHPMMDDCPICLSEFHEGEIVKLIPYCRHVFHPSCIDTWLASHVTCPLCRSAELFRKVEEVCLDVVRDKGDTRAPEIGDSSTAENGDTWRHEGSDRVR